MNQHNANRPLRHAIYAICILASTVMMLARIATVHSNSGRTPFLSANDRSRWSTIRALVDHRTFELDAIVFHEGKRDRDWYSIDMVRHQGRDGREHYYSSKPPLLTVALAAEYWLIRAVTGASLADKPMYVGRIMLVLSNVVPLVGLLVLMATIIERLGRSDWGRIIAVAAGCFATMLTTISVTLTNHLPGAVGVGVSLYAFLRILDAPDERRGRRWYCLAGIAAGFLVANEFPALSLAGLLGAILAWHDWRRTLAWFTPPLAALLFLLLLCNYLAHDSWRPAYAHRGDGARLLEVESRFEQLESGPAPAAMVQALNDGGLKVSPRTVVCPIDDQRWTLWDEATQSRYALRAAESGRTAVHVWDDWYRYEGTYWVPERLAGVDRGEPYWPRYLFHVLIGHHGVFSLTPLWLLVPAGSWLWNQYGTRGQRWLVRAHTVAALVCLAFYTIGRPTIDRNYGGVTSGFRWMYWFIPIWLLLIVPALDWLADPAQVRNRDADDLRGTNANDDVEGQQRTSVGRSRVRSWGKRVVLVAFAVSVFSAAYPIANPWVHPWIYAYWQHLGWIQE
ncbi:MAG: hypothetical protein FJ295_16655 [Planctomycetes bacterium]|nr:hypothetical protein [Planctomycetota bacterium]